MGRVTWCELYAQTIPSLDSGGGERQVCLGGLFEVTLTAYIQEQTLHSAPGEVVW